MGDNDFLFSYLSVQKDGDGKVMYTEDEINEYINKLNPIERKDKVEALKSNLRAAQQKELQAKNAEAEAKRQEAFNSWDKNRQEMIKDTVKKMSLSDNIAGIPLTQSDLEEFVPIFDKMTQFNKETGQLYMDDFLQSNNENVFTALYLLHKSKKGDIEKHLSNVKESFKESILEKTGVKPNISGGSSATASGETIPTSSSFF
jgi:hypothetical protein